MNIKISLSILATIIGTLAFYPYLRDIISLKTKPHMYTWLIWVITQGTAIIGMWYGGGSWGTMNLIFGTFLVMGVFLFSFKYGTKNITKTDTVILVLALGAIFIWWQTQQPLLAVIMVSAIDFLGYIPSFRKSYKDPWSETLLTWIAFSISNTLAIFALGEYNLLTMTYLVTITLANLTLFSICFFRRPLVGQVVSSAVE